MGHDIVVVTRAAFQTFAHSLGAFLPRALSALLILIAGWLLAATLRAVTRRILVWLRFDPLLERLGGGKLLRGGGFSPQNVLAGVVYWLSWAAVGAAVLQVLGISGAQALVADFVRFLPRLVSAAIVVVVGSLLASLAWRAAVLAAVSARMRAAKQLGGLARALLLAATASMALEQLGIGSGVMHIAFAIAFGAVMLALAIAFGLGGRHAARRFLEERLLARGKDPKDEPHHL